MDDSIAKPTGNYPDDLPPGYQGNDIHPHAPPGYPGSDMNPYPPPVSQGNDMNPYPPPVFQGNDMHPYPPPGFQANDTHPYPPLGFQGNDMHPYPPPRYPGNDMHPYPSTGYPGNDMRTNTPIRRVTPDFGRLPQQTTCANCNKVVVTNVVLMPGECIGLLVLAACVVCIPFFWVPLFLDSCKDARHTCPSCNSVLGVYYPTVKNWQP